MNIPVKGAMAAKFRCCGQACVAANRFYVETSIYDEFLGKLKEKVEKLKCGNGMDKSVDIGPMINQKAVDKVRKCGDRSICLFTC
jgi:succinate-semialdehyde dehydrogenase/glutarate-semialdehyde dehydrogenase